eukprot:CAMPEP_0174742618 /NCGR_PEP_ID=MMETSP1094-20130205/79409_1 /TAXON_ID=156173 /ORGANISM="Chrysochromulina brevifilum, Strain UTEX LB 985" /LENGTH=60 /DNA_ID=CAMNT_0015946703 /DNA_START=112 /DNA_END=292 /DNA_ORIENTATION=-
MTHDRCLTRHWHPQVAATKRAHNVTSNAARGDRSGEKAASKASKQRQAQARVDNKARVAA